MTEDEANDIASQLLSNYQMPPKSVTADVTDDDGNRYKGTLYLDSGEESSTPIEDPTPEQALLTTTTNFAQTLLTAGCSPEFICTQAFNYVISAQVQKHRLELAMMCSEGGDYFIDKENTGYMDIAAQVLVQVVTALGKVKING